MSARSESMTTLTGFEFQCPACRVRLSIDEQQRGQRISCPHCHWAMTAPRYYLGRPGWRPRSVHESLTGECPTVDPAVAADDDSLPVARTFTREDRRWSLQHLMLSTSQRLMGDAMLGARARRRFEFYCGDCGSIQTARVWDIASQQPCSSCDSFVIIPAPCPRAASHDSHTARRRRAPSPKAGLFCPQCGIGTPQADRTRQTRAYCRHCTLWF
jgi:hypothetical protein